MKAVRGARELGGRGPIGREWVDADIFALADFAQAIAKAQDATALKVVISPDSTPETS